MNQRYSHRNGETDAPTESGYFWARGSMTANDDPCGIYAVMGVVYIVPPNEDIEMEHFFVRMADTGMYSHVMPDSLLCRWWGPVTPPWGE